MRKISNLLRFNVGRKSIPKNYYQHISQKSKALKDIYKVYADAEVLLNSVMEKINLEGNSIVKVMANGGQGFLKISLIIILPENYSTNSC